MKNRRGGEARSPRSSFSGAGHRRPAGASNPKKAVEWAHVINYSALFGFLGLFIFLEVAAGQAARPNFLGYYANIFFDPVRSSLLWIPTAILTYLFIRFLVLFASGAIRARPPTWKNLILGKGGTKSIIGAFKTLASFGVPAILALFAITLVLGHINALNAGRLEDELVASWDKALTGTYPFLSWGNISYPKWFFDAVIFSFGTLPALFLIFGIYLAHERREFFKEFTAAFSLALLIMLPFWLKVPALSPQDRFMDNVYKLPVSAQIDAELQNYRPQEELREFLAAVREKKADFAGALPTSTLPSAHVAWATLLVIYAWRAVKKIGLLLLPIAALSTFGTVLLAQHYFVDIPAGIVVAFVSAALVYIATAKNWRGRGGSFTARPASAGLRFQNPRF